MKKNIFFWIMALMICTIVSSCADNANFELEEQAQKRVQLSEKLSHEVTQAEARQSLEKFIADMKISSTRSGEQKCLPPITSVYTRGTATLNTRAGEEIEPYFHIFNFGNAEGLAIMSGDDRVEPLLALTFQGQLTPDTEIDNPGFKIAYKRMEDYYVAKTMGGPSIDIDIPIPPKEPLPDPIQTIEYIEMPLGYCPVKWDQFSPYNRYCHDQEGSEATAGCASIALAQLMAIYKYPDSYRYFSYSIEETFDWVDMVSRPASSTGIDQIARLVYNLGRPNNLCMNYKKGSDGGSGSDPANVPRTLRNFGYENGGRIIDYNVDSVVLELMQGYPLLLRGKTAEGSGHIWLGHGLMVRSVSLPLYAPSLQIIWTDPVDTYYILCNWGWKGNSDGYYLSNVFNTIEGPVFPDPDSPIEVDGDYNFQTNIQAYINIRR